MTTLGPNEWHFVMRQRTAALTVFARLLSAWVEPSTDPVCAWSLWIELPTGLTAWHVPTSCEDLLEDLVHLPPQQRQAPEAAEREQRLLDAGAWLQFK